MKVAYFIGSLNRGGAESLIYDICRQHGHVPYEMVCVYRHDGDLSDDFRLSGAPLLQVPKQHGLLRYLRNLRKTFLRENVTIVHSQTPSNTLLLALALLGTGIEIITTFHGYLFAGAPLWQRKIVYAVSKKIVCVSRHQKSFYEKQWGLPEQNKLQVVYNGIDFSKIDLAEPSTEIAKQPQRFRLAMVGSFINGRSQNIIVKSIHRLQQTVNDQLPTTNDLSFDFYFIGRRDLKEPWRYDECVHYCEENQLTNVHFLGSRGDVPSLLKSIDGFVYSTEHDTFGIAVIEAIAAGLPVIVNDWQVMTEVCNLNLPETNQAIRFFRTDDVDDCARSIATLVMGVKNDRKKLHADCLQAAEAAKSKYSIQSHISQLEDIYASLNIHSFTR